jgi:hypothetical protein
MSMGWGIEVRQLDPTRQYRRVVRVVLQCGENCLRFPLNEQVLIGVEPDEVDDAQLARSANVHSR